MTKKEIIDYIMYTPSNTNISVLNPLLDGFSNKDQIIQYVFHTPHNMNRRILERLIGKDGGVAIVDEAIVCEAIVG